MSVINQMLRDLDSRRGPANGAQLAALQSLGLVSTNRIQWPGSLAFLGWGLGGALLIIISYQAVNWWMHKSRPAHVSAPVEQLIADDSALAETVPAAKTGPAVSMPAPAEISDTQPQQTAVAEVSKSREPVAVADKIIPRPIRTLTPRQKAERVFVRAQQALANHQPQRGERLLRDTLNEFPGHTAARTQLVALLVSRQQTEKAELLLADGLSTDPYQLELARPYAQLLAARDVLMPALEALDRASNQAGADAESLALRAALLYRMDRHAESVIAYRRALDDQPQRALWWTGLAVSLEHSGESAQALAAYRRAVDLPLEKAVNDYVQQRIEKLRYAGPRN